MLLDDSHRLLGKVPVDLFKSLKDEILKFDDWDRDTRRQDKYLVHKKTKSLNLKLSLGPHDQFEQDVWSHWWIFVAPILVHCEDYYGRYNGCVRAVIAKLPAGCEIPEHKDGLEQWKFSHRVHLPIVADPDCEFYCRNELIPMVEGNLVEISNLDLHRVEHKGTIDRIHLIFDYVDYDGLQELKKLEK